MRFAHTPVPAAHRQALLVDVPVGARAIIGGDTFDPRGSRRLRELGMRPGASVTVVQKTSGGGRIVSVGAHRYALGAQALRSITVSAA
ncbi:FeoA family protein [Corynebacterium liangguodongii]|uniref:Ferrous iron transport protein A n=1 Tax=Corynebacterium liangguodongii TaxID=2079535 RepID=A0A2S0WC21_9CORY|nr:ferrous iron transport protein A [Corynebacterium liangguodongii]AWB83321.1 ferrous iron transport protein A [Corynebacterium liangguodongii]PWC00589.1 ferrous iron transport protein A [Corynebacterium liangguodongii]